MIPGEGDIGAMGGLSDAAEESEKKQGDVDMEITVQYGIYRIL